ncbi:XRE family transcriptional regulator [Streptomyces sp. NPDC054796]
MYANARLEARINQLGYSQAELARRINVEIELLTGRTGCLTDADIRRWLRGDTKWPQDRIRLCAEKVLQASSQNLGFVPRSKRSKDDPVHRRRFLTSTSGAAVAVASGTVAAPRLGMSDVGRLELDYRRILRSERTIGGSRPVENQAVELATRIESAFADAGSDSVRRHFYRLASDVTCTAAFAALDAKAPQRARPHLERALTFAGLSRDAQAVYRVWDQLMLNSSMRENHAEAAASADVMKRSAAARRDPLFASLGYMRSANALARIQQPTEALRALSLAEKAFGRAGDDKHPGWIGFYDAAEFDALSSYVWTALGKHDRAESRLHHTLAAIPGSKVRDKGLFTAHLALAQARQGELELACATGTRAHDLLLPGSGSKRTISTLARTREVIAGHSSKAPEVTDWIEESRQWS